MKSLVVLFAGEITGYGLEKINGLESALERSLVWAQQVSDVSAIIVCASNAYPLDKMLTGTTVACQVITREAWTASGFFSCVAENSIDFDHVLIAWADCPFLDRSITETLLAKHRRYAAEYTFADGYPYGFAPDILARGVLPMLASLAKDSLGPVTRDLVFETLKKDINSFDIETDIAPIDLRQLRLCLACDTKRNFTQCQALDGINTLNYGKWIEERSSVLRTIPAFYAVQVAGACPYECVYCPYPAFCRSGKGTSPKISPVERIDQMSLPDFKNIVDKIADYSEDAVVSLSLWGESSYHPEIASLVGAVLAHPGLSVLIETTGLGWREETLSEIATIVNGASVRLNGQKPVTWIVSLDAVGSACYGAVHGLSPERAEPAFREALACTENLLTLFPDSVWVQTIRMNENETELESFYRFWKQKTGRVIVQKHDHCCASIVDRRVADLSPLVRHPCWHLKRDMCIMIDGTVPLCREDIYATRAIGNAITDSLSDIWVKGQAVYEQHTKCNYEGMCGACDEYYTYNF